MGKASGYDYLLALLLSKALPRIELGSLRSERSILPLNYRARPHPGLNRSHDVPNVAFYH